jgi:hypothetical protein
MPVKLFGQFLVDEGLITPRQLKDVEDHTYYVHRALGELAVKHGMLTLEQCAQVLERQAWTDRFFGEICVREGLLTPAQVERLLELQRGLHSRVGEVLIELGHLREKQLEEALARYRAEQGRYDAPRVLPAALGGGAAAAVLDLFPRLVLRVGGLHARLGELQEWAGSLSAPVALAVRVASPSGLRIGIGSEPRFAASLLRLARGSVEPAVPAPELPLALGLLAQRLARQIDPTTARGPEGEPLPQAGFACEFGSMRGNGLLVLAPASEPD